MKFLDNSLIKVIKKIFILCIALIVFCIQTKQNVMADEAKEYAVKAAFTYNFIRFVQWPEISSAHDADPFLLCFLGNEVVEKSFNTLNNKKIGIRAIKVHRLFPEKKCEQCDIIFISRDIDRSISKEIISKVKGTPVLTISETKEFTTYGGMINFVIKDGRLRFIINTSASKNQNLKISSRLLKLAIVVDEL